MTEHILIAHDLRSTADLALRRAAQLARQHNNANILCIPARFVSSQDAQAMVETFLTTAFEGGRHEKRVGKIDSGPVSA